MLIFKSIFFRLIELDEAIEALDSAIEFKNYNINSKQLELRHSQILSQVGYDVYCLLLWEKMHADKLKYCNFFLYFLNSFPE